MATATNKIPQGSDKDIRITVKDSATQAPVDLATLDEITCIIYYQQNSNDHPLQTYDLNDTSKEPLVIVDAPNGIFKILLQSKTTKEAQIGDIFAEVKTETDDVNFDDDTKHDVVRDILVAQIVRALTQELP